MTATFLVNAVPTPFVAILPLQGASFTTLVPMGLVGNAAMIQCAVVSPLAQEGILALTDAHEFHFVP